MPNNGNVPVTIFNCSGRPVNINVNNGNQFAIAPTSADKNWQPQPSAPGSTSFSNNYPSPNQFGFGPNYVALHTDGSSENIVVHINQMYMPRSFQLYLFLNNYGISYKLLESGTAVAEGGSASQLGDTSGESLTGNEVAN